MKTVYFSFIAGLFLLFSCTEKTLDPISESKGKPGVVTIQEVTPQPGGALVTYQIPNEEDILEVKAVYTVTNGTTHEIVASYYSNQLLITGFNDEQAHSAKIYTINRAMVASDPVDIQFTPLESSVSKVVKTINIEAFFGGALYNWENTDKASLTFSLLASDENGRLQTMQLATSQKEFDGLVLRGYDSKPTLFAIIVSDRWGNASDTIYPGEGLLTPLPISTFDKKMMSFMNLNNDANWGAYGMSPIQMLDDQTGNNNCGHTLDGTVPGAALTIDLGVKGRISDLILHQREMYGSFYNSGNVKRFEVWGRSDTPSKSGDWDEWTFIQEFDTEKPSGPSGAVTDADIEFAKAGIDYVFPVTRENYRYIRLRVLESFSMSLTYISEITFLGAPAE